MSKRVTYSPIGIDIAEESIKILQLRKQKDTISIYHASKIDLTNYQDKKELHNKLHKLLSAARIKGKQAIVTLPSSQITSTPIKFNVREGESIDRAILREAPNYLPFSLEDEVIDYLTLPLSDQLAQLSVLLIAARRGDIMGYLELLTQMGLEAIAIEPRYCSLFRTIKWIKEGSLDNQFIFYLDENNTIVMVLIDEKIFIVREISWGLKMIKDKIEKELGLGGNKIETILQQYDTESEPSNKHNHKKIGPLDAREFRQILHEVITPPLEELCQEIQKVLSYCVSMFQQRVVIDHALLFGKAMEINSLDQFIQQRIGIGIETLKDTAKTKKMLAPYPLFETALGLALRDNNA